MPKLPLNIILQKITQLPGWKLVGERLEREFTLNNFPTAVILLNKFVDPIEEQENYPEITLRYNRLKISLKDTVAGGISERDLAVAENINRIIDGD